MTEIQPTPEPQVPAPTSEGEPMWKKAQAMARANIIPKSFQNNPANCFVALEMAHRMGASPFEVMQNLNVIHGSPSWSAKYVIARANQSGVFTGPIAFEQSGSGASLSVTAFATVAATGVRAEFTCDMAMAKSEKWDSNPKYKSGLAALMLHYRAATFLVKLTCPEVLLGMQTSEEPGGHARRPGRGIRPGCGIHQPEVAII